MARQHATPADFELVGMSEDPTPGDPQLIQGILQRYNDIGDAADRALTILKKDGEIAVGRGSAMDKLREKIGDDLPDKLTKTATSYRDAAAAYRDYIPKLQEAQDTFDRAVEQARSAAPQANQTPPVLAADATDEDKVAAAKAQDAIDAGKSRMSAARSLAEQAQTMRETAQRSCADVLDRAAGEAIPERDIFQKIADFFEEFPFVQLLLGLLIAVISVFFPVVGLLLGAALFAVTQVAAIASGNFKLGDFLVGLIALVPGASVVKVLGGVVKAGAGAVAKVAPLVTKSGSGTITGITSSISASKTIGPLVNSTAGQVAAGGAKGFAEGAAEQAATQVLNGEGLDPGQIAAGGALGAVLGGVAGGVAGRKGGKGLNAGAAPGGIPVKTAPGTGTRALDGPDPSSPPVTTHVPDPDDPFLDVPRTVARKNDPDNPLGFTHTDSKTGVSTDFTLTRTDTFPPVFTVNRTGEQIFFDEDINKFRKFEGGNETSFDSPLSDFSQGGVTIPKDHFQIQGLEGQSPGTVKFSDLDRVSDGKVVLVPTDQIPDGLIRADLDPQRVQKIKDGFAQGIALPAVSLDSNLTVNDGNHRIRAAKDLGLPFVPVKIT
ncbi:ParB N-terminal domain-containing protein [Couchioplanes caeruleus]|uniref:ParB/Sulfiredoxin domain-containing protein n=2 Tax=Couchioplanes caeruleus TaxID=56438 RepID=A0A1K0FDT4_9ACTN|nr:hypothetical protein [Couchioplanes caeruleus]OJF10999.1 hypothetical protein BG844_28880 [Couchioplanes caeruleus subsp. caeruleus]ROP29831.1 hypothetical protein EDD30_2651 [Couchioplanes caeruleus]